MQSLLNLVKKAYAKPVEVEVEDTISKYIQEDILQEMFCFVLNDCSLYSLSTKNNGQQRKDCLF